jgi:hypothetical protein
MEKAAESSGPYLSLFGNSQAEAWATSGCDRSFDGFDTDELTHPAAITKLDDAGDFGKQGMVAAQAYIFARLEGCAALTNNDGTAGHYLAAEHLDTEPLRVGIAPVFGTA